MNTLIVAVFVACVAVCAGQLGGTQGSSGSAMSPQNPPASSVPPLGQSGSGMTSLGQSGSDMTSLGQSGFGMPILGQSGSGMPTLGQSGSGMPTLGQSGSGMPTLGQSGTAMSPMNGGQGPLNTASPSPSPMGGGPLSNTARPGANIPMNNRGGGLNQVFRNPLMTYGLMGGDNLKRAVMLPFLSRFGGSNTANYYYLRGGMDKYMKVMMTDMINNMLARSTGMNPMMTALMTGQMFDAPDNYALSNMIFNRFGGGMGGMGGMNGMGGGMSNAVSRMNNAVNAMRGMGGNNGGSGQGQGVGMLPVGAASLTQQQPTGYNMFSSLNPMALASMSLM